MKHCEMGVNIYVHRTKFYIGIVSCNKRGDRIEGYQLLMWLLLLLLLTSIAIDWAILNLFSGI